MMLKHMLTASNGPPPPPSVVMAPATTLMNGHPASAMPRTQTAADGIVMLTDIAPSHAAAAARLRNGSTISPLIAQQQQQLNLNLSQRLNQSHALNVSTLSTSKHSLGNSSGVSPGGAGGMVTMNGPVTQVVVPPAGQTTPKMANGGLRISRVGSHSGSTTLLPANVSRFMTRSKEAGIKEMLTSLGLLCLVSLLLALLSLIFLLKISPMATTDIRDLLRNEQLTIISADEYVVVYEVTLALCALTLSLNLCCLLVCAIQFLFAVKLVKSPQGGERTNKYLQKSSITRVCAVGGFFISIPVFLTGIILYTFIQFHSTPAIITSVFIGLGIIFCGCAMVHNVFVWQKEKTNAVRALAQQQREHQQSLRQPPTPPTPVELTKPCHPRDASGSVSPGVPTATLDLSSVTTTTPHELSTLV